MFPIHLVVLDCAPGILQRTFKGTVCAGAIAIDQPFVVGPLPSKFGNPKRVYDGSRVPPFSLPSKGRMEFTVVLKFIGHQIFQKMEQ